MEGRKEGREKRSIIHAAGKERRSPSPQAHLSSDAHAAAAAAAELGSAMCAGRGDAASQPAQPRRKRESLPLNNACDAPAGAR